MMIRSKALQPNGEVSIAMVVNGSFPVIIVKVKVTISPLPPHTMLNLPFSHRPLYTLCYSFPKRNRRNWLWKILGGAVCVCGGGGERGGRGGKVYVKMVDGWR